MVRVAVKVHFPGISRRGLCLPATRQRVCVLSPALTVFPNTDDNIEAIVTSVETLSMSLRAVADESEGVVLEVVLELGQGPVTPLVDDLLRASEVQSLDSTSLLL